MGPSAGAFVAMQARRSQRVGVPDLFNVGCAEPAARDGAGGLDEPAPVMEQTGATDGCNPLICRDTHAA
jgi:hypothetical protein